VDISNAIAQANSRLKPLKISIQQRGERLNLQATLPPKPKLRDLQEINKSKNTLWDTKDV